jgi:hypothetical protein
MAWAVMSVDGGGYCQRRRDRPGFRLPPQGRRQSQVRPRPRASRIDFRSDECDDVEGRERQERGTEGEGEGWWMVRLTQGRAVLGVHTLGDGDQAASGKEETRRTKGQAKQARPVASAAFGKSSQAESVECAMLERTPSKMPPSRQGQNRFRRLRNPLHEVQVGS